MKSLVVAIVDESSSMGGRKGSVIEGYNAFLTDQMKLTEDQANYIFIKFASNVEVVLNNVPITQSTELTNETYTPNGMTALYAAIHKGITLATAVQADFDRIIVLIITDGEENNSGPEYSQANVASMIKARTALENWTFIYIGWDPEKVSKKLNIDVGNAMAYDVAQPQAMFHKANLATAHCRQTLSAQSFGLFSNRRSPPPPRPSSFQPSRINDILGMSHNSVLPPLPLPPQPKPT
jgi:Mg-chelatase subunit ChlD